MSSQMHSEILIANHISVVLYLKQMLFFNQFAYISNKKQKLVDLLI